MTHPAQQPLSAVESPTVLVIEDDVMVLSVTRLLLRKQGYSSVGVQDGDSALAFFRGAHREVSMILMDMNLPGLSAEETAVRLKAIRRDVPVVLMSGYGEEELEFGFCDVDLAGFLRKPFGAAELEKVVREVQARRRDEADGYSRS